MNQQEQDGQNQQEGGNVEAEPVLVEEEQGWLKDFEEKISRTNLPP